MQFKVPQNIDIQDKIIGPLTMMQFIYTVLGFGVCYVIFMSGLPKIIAYFLIVPIALLILCLDFIKINERPFQDFLLSAIQYSLAPKKRVWKHSADADYEVEIIKIVKDNKPHTATKSLKPEEIKALAQKFDTGK